MTTMKWRVAEVGCVQIVVAKPVSTNGASPQNAFFWQATRGSGNAVNNVFSGELGL